MTSRAGSDKPSGFIKNPPNSGISVLCCFPSPLDDDEEEGSYDTDEGQDYRAHPPRDVTSSSSMIGPSPSSIVKLEANQKARNKKQRQELYGKTVL